MCTASPESVLVPDPELLFEPDALPNNLLVDLLREPNPVEEVDSDDDVPPLRRAIMSTDPFFPHTGTFGADCDGCVEDFTPEGPRLVDDAETAVALKEEGPGILDVPRAGKSSELGLCFSTVSAARGRGFTFRRLVPFPLLGQTLLPFPLFGLELELVVVVRKVPEAVPFMLEE